MNIKKLVKQPISSHLRGAKILLICFVSLICLAATLKVMITYDGAKGPGLTTQTWPAGTFLSHIDRGGRMVSFHRGYAYMNGFTSTSTWDISNPAAPIKVQDLPLGSNGHRWWKMGDMFWREYDVPEVTGSGYQFLDLSNMLNRKPWTKAAPIPIEASQSHFQDLETFPHTYDGNNVYDMRSREFMGIADFSAAPNQELKIRIGNLLIFFGNGAATYDIGDPKNIRLLDVITGKFTQYTTTYQVWRNYIIFLSGDNTNEGNNNLVAIDFSDPADLKYAFGIPFEDTPGRYMFFQDEYGFTGRQQNGVKINLETRKVELRFTRPDHPLSFSDFQWIPLGHILMASGAESGDGETFFFSHSDKLDTKAPYVSYNNPANGATNQPLSTAIGFVINETLDDLTITPQNVQVRPIGGDVIEGDLVSSSYNVINFAPKKALLPNTTYEVKIVGGGIKDVSGNGVVEKIFYFSTGGGLATNHAPKLTQITSSVTAPVAVGTLVNFTAAATDSDGDSLKYRWDFGGGAPKTSFSSSNKASHVFDKAGIFQVFVQVTDNKGIVSDFTPLVVVESTTAGTSKQSSQIIVDNARRRVWTVNPDNNTVTVINADNNTKVNEVTVGAHPTSLALGGDGNIWVTCRDSDKIYILDGVSAAAVSTISLKRGSQPFSIVFTPDGSTAYVSEFGSGAIAKIGTTAKTVSAELAVGPTPRALAITGDSKSLLVTRFISPDDAGKVWKINLTTFTVESTIDLPLDNLTQDSGSNGRGLPNYLDGITINPSNQKAWVVAKKDNILRGLKRDGNAMIFENTVRNAISPINLTTNKEDFAGRVDIDDHSQPSAALYSPLGSHLFLTFQSNNHLIILDPSTGKEITRQDVGLAPQGVALDPTTKKVFVNNFMDRSVSVFDAADLLTKGATSITKVATISTVSKELLPAQVLKGKQVFYNAADLRMSQDGYISCAVCHIDGTHDGRTWDFTDRGEGLRNTTALRGRAGNGNGRVHWSGNFDEIQDFEHDIRGAFKGKGFMSDADFNTGTRNKPLGDPKAGVSAELDALAAYLKSLDTFSPSPSRNADGSLTADAVAGKDLFTTLKCGACHSGNNFTDSDDNILHDIGTMSDATGRRLSKTILGIDAQTLRDVWSTAPYLHDGSAATLKDVLTTKNATGAHTNGTTLTSTQADQLVAYLKQIDGSEPASSAPLVLKMTSPLDNSIFLDQTAIPLSLNTNIPGITKVVYFADGQQIAQSTTSPYSATWTPVKWKKYAVQAKVFYNGGKTASATPEVNIKYKGEFNAMMVVGDVNLSNGDKIVKKHLEDYGCKIEVIDDDIVNGDMGRLKDIVFVSSTCLPSSIGEDLTHIPVPIFSWHPFSYSYLRLSGSNYEKDFGYTTTPFNSVDIVKPGHPMAGGKTGKIKLYNMVQRIPFGRPSSPNSVILAKADTLPIIFGNPKGTDSYSQERKVAFPLRGDFIHLFTEDGWDLFDAAVDWALYGGDATTGLQPRTDIRITSPVAGAVVGQSFNITFNLDNWPMSPQGNQVHVLIDNNHVKTISTLDPIPVTNLAVGAHTIVLQLAKEGYGRYIIKSTVNVTVVSNPSNKPPVAKAVGTPTSGLAPLTVALDASGSTDPDNDPLTFSWTFGDGTSGAGAKPSKVYTTPGSYTAKVTVTDGKGGSADASIVITVTGNSKPVAVATANKTTGNAPLAVTFNASGSSDADGDVLTFNWTFGDGTTATGATPTKTYSTVGNYDAIVTVSDGKGGTAQVTIKISVTDPTNKNPVAKISATPTTGKAPLAVAFSGSGSSDPDGDPLTYSWSFGDGTTATGVTASKTYASANTFKALLTVTDGRGGSAKDSISIKVDAGACTFGTPSAAAIPSINGTFNKIYQLGTGGPNLSNVTGFTINWDLQQKGLWQFSVNTNNGTPNWYVDLRTVSTPKFGQVQPEVTFTNSGFSGLDGQYWATITGGNLALVSKTGGYTIYFSNSATPPTCSSTARKDFASIEAEGAEMKVYPNPSEDEFTLELGLASARNIRVIDQTGRMVEKIGHEKLADKTIQFGRNLKPGLYFIYVEKSNGLQVLKIDKR